MHHKKSLASIKESEASEKGERIIEEIVFSIYCQNS